MQLYFLSVFCNLFAGLFLVLPRDKEDSFFAETNGVYRLVIAILTFLTGLLKFFFVVQPDIIILGDFIPAVAGLIAGACLLIEYYNAHSSASLKMNEFFERLFIQWKKYIGYFSLAVCLIHFLFPNARMF